MKPDNMYLRGKERSEAERGTVWRGRSHRTGSTQGLPPREGRGLPDCSEALSAEPTPRHPSELSAC